MVYEIDVAVDDRWFYGLIFDTLESACSYWNGKDRIERINTMKMSYGFMSPIQKIRWRRLSAERVVMESGVLDARAIRAYVREYNK
jgi:hypothetical protein